MLQDAKHPLLVIGAGANRKVTSNMLRRLVENTGLPFCDTQMGKGVIDSSARHTCTTPDQNLVCSICSGLQYLLLRSLRCGDSNLVARGSLVYWI